MSPAEAQSRVALAVFISIALHGLLLLWLRGVSVETPEVVAAEPRVLTAQLSRPDKPSLAPASIPVKEPEPPREKPRLSDKAPTPKPQPLKVPSPPAPASAPAPSGGIDLADALDAAPIVQAEVFDPTLVGRYRAALIIEMNRRRFYPLSARARNQTGKVEMRLEFSAGQLLAVVVIRSSGYEILDEGAMQIARAAFAETVMPPALRERSFSVEPVQVDYDLEPLPR